MDASIPADFDIALPSQVSKVLKTTPLDWLRCATDAKGPKYIKRGARVLSHRWSDVPQYPDANTVAGQS